MSSTGEHLPDRHVFIPSLEAAALALSHLPAEWLDDRDVQAVLAKFTTAVSILKGLN